MNVDLLLKRGKTAGQS